MYYSIQYPLVLATPIQIYTVFTVQIFLHYPAVPIAVGDDTEKQNSYTILIAVVDEFTLYSQFK